MAEAGPLRTRRIWLRRLFELVQDNLRAGVPITEQQRHLAGLTRVQYLYVDEQQGDLILEGPAEDRWESRQDGIALGKVSGQPLLELDDFAVAWRNAAEGARPPSVSLDVRPEARQRVAQVIRRAGHPASAAARRRLQQQLQQAWGEQDAISGGVPQDTRFHKVMVDADWQMKRISLGLLKTALQMAAYVDLEFRDLERRVRSAGARARKPPGGSRFWFYPAYSEFARSDDSGAVEIPDQAVGLLTESHFLTLGQNPRALPNPSPAARQFAEAFSANYSAIANDQPIYAYLRNLFDWVAIARIIQLLGIPGRIGWDLGFVRSGFPVQRVPTPRTMPGLVAVRHGQIQTPQGIADLVFPARGGVAMDLAKHFELDRWRLDPGLRRRHQAVLAARPARQDYTARNTLAEQRQRDVR